MNDHLRVAIEAATQAGEYQIQQFGTVTDYGYKAPGDPISEIDTASEDIILEYIAERFPNDAIISEESGTSGSAEDRWIVDPLDGTSNYVREIPDFTVSIAFERSNRIEAGVVYRPFTDDLFAASRDGNSPDEGVNLSISETHALENSLAAVPYSSATNESEHIWDVHRKLGETIEGIRSTGSGALDLAYFAAGKFDIVYGIDQKRWDCAAGLFLAEMAGAKITDHQGNEVYEGNFLVSNGKLHEEVRLLTVSDTQC